MLSFRTISTSLLTLIGILPLTASLAAGDRIWIDNQTNQPLIVRDIQTVNMSEGDFYQHEVPYIGQVVPTGRVFHFALINWASLFPRGLKFTIQTKQTWENSCKFVFSYEISEFEIDRPVCTGNIGAPSLAKYGESKDGIIDWTITLRKVS